MSKPAHATDIVGYTYRADLYCPACIITQSNCYPDGGMWIATAEQLLSMRASQLNIDRMDETTFDSGEFPKVVFRDMLTCVEVCECGRVKATHDGRIACGRWRPCGFDTTDRCGSCGEVLG